MPDHAHDFAVQTFVLSGVLEETVDGRVHEAGPGWRVTKPAGVWHRNRVAPIGARLLEIRIPTWSLPDGFEYQWRKTPRDMELAGRLREALYLDHGVPALGLEESCALAVASGIEKEERPHLPAPWIQRVAELLREEHDRPIRHEEIAQRLGVHPVALSRAFRRAFQCSMGDFLRRIRVEHAVRVLSGSEGISLADLAAESGFADQSHLTRTVKRYTGLTPGDLRALTRA